MRKPIIFAAASLTLAAAGGTAFAQTTAQPPAPAAPTEAAPLPAPPSPPHPWMRMGDWHHGGMHDRMAWHHRPMPFAPGTFGLFTHQTDKHLTTSDVQTIAQGILLMNGQHDWKVGQVESAPNHQVTFAYTAQDGTVIAKFSVDQQTGRISRVG